MHKLFLAVYETLEKGGNAVLCSVIASSGSTPRGAGAKMLVTEAGKTFGTIGGGAVELAAVKTAKEMIIAGESQLKSFNLSSEGKADLGMICGGNATVYFQLLKAGSLKTRELIKYALSLWDKDSDAWLITPIQEGGAPDIGIWAEGRLHITGVNIQEKTIMPYLLPKSAYIKGETPLYIEPLIQTGTVYIFGGGHVGQALVPVLSGVNFRTVVFDDRERFANISLFPGATAAILGDFSCIGTKASITDKDYVVIVTRGHEADYIVLEQALRSPATYVGMIGSRNKMEHTIKMLKKTGFGEDDINRIHNPIGIDIKAETPAEIAISITAELIRHRALINTC